MATIVGHAQGGIHTSWSHILRVFHFSAGELHVLFQLNRNLGCSEKEGRSKAVLHRSMGTGIPLVYLISST